MILFTMENRKTFHRLFLVHGLASSENEAHDFCAFFLDISQAI